MKKRLPLLNPDDETLSMQLSVYLSPHLQLNGILSDDLYYLDRLINRKLKMGISKEILGKEAELLVQIKSGGIAREKALNYLFEKHVNFVHRGVSRYNLTQVESKEVFLDTLLAFVSAIEKKQYNGDSRLSTYLYRIFENRAKNKIRDRMRQESKFQWVEEVPIIPDKAKSMLQDMVQEEEMNWVEKMLEKLGEKCKQILMMQEFQGYSLDEIAKQMGYKSSRAVSTTKYRCLEKLKQILS